MTMNILYTQTNDFGYDSYSVSTIPDDSGKPIGVLVTYVKDGQAMSIPVLPEHIMSHTGESVFQDNSSYYGAFLGEGRFAFINKRIETFYTKHNGHEYGRLLNIQVPIQIYIPWAGATLEDATIRVCGPGVPEFDGVPMDESKRVETNSAAYEAVAMKTLPRLEAPPTSTSPVRVQLTLDGAPHARAGVKVVAQLDGSLITTSALTDENGIATFTAAPGDLVQFGFRHLTNVARTRIV